MTTRPVSEPGCKWSHLPLDLKHKRGEGPEEERTAPPDPRKLGCAHKGPGSRVGMAWGTGGGGGGTITSDSARATRGSRGQGGPAVPAGVLECHG